MTFEDLKLNKPILQALSDLEYVHPTPIQEKAYPVIMGGRNVVGIAQTGTGKTFAYLLPLLQSLTFSKQREPRILILAPTRVLVVQIVNEIKKLTEYTSFRSAGVYGDTNMNTQKQLVYDGLDILVATPGRLIDLAFTGVLRLKSVKKVVIDEVDEMLSLGLRPQLLNVLDLLPAKRQNLMFSATKSPDIEEVITSSIPTPVTIEITPHGTPIESIAQTAYHTPNFYTKVNLLVWLLEGNPEITRALVFVNSKRSADRLFDLVESKLPSQVGVIHSNKAHNTRLTALKNFQEGTHRILIATDIVARGMDITDVSHVINFEMPDTPSDYIHRIGRTGRASKDGVAISFVAEGELDYHRDIEQMMGKPITLDPLPNGLEVSTQLLDEEKPAKAGDKQYLKAPPKRAKGAAFHEKKEKNKKVNLGGPKNRKEKYEKIKKAKRKDGKSKIRF